MKNEINYFEYPYSVEGTGLLNKNKKYMQKSWYQSRTMWLAILQGVIGIFMAVYNANPAFSSVGWVMVVKSFIDGYIRLTATTS